MLANGSLYTNIMEQLHFEPDIDEFNITQVLTKSIKNTTILED
jgi:hypothetical protein